ncbi:YdcF family protein [Thauera sp.]|uniref:YdcF family protein n=1 Tax=Thauera sp. TaxID=1905334 RepID=UPI0025899FD8|nr:YdcF family protein [Thauera sp.]HNR59831.1 YdcF family protein [Thauera sp.]HNS93115.1 YdcF family protein [Thauera sp.]
MDLALTPLLFWLKKIVAALVLPPLLPLLPIVLGLLLGMRWRRLGNALAWSGVALNLLLISPPSVSWLVRQVEHAQALEADAARRAQAIVILGAGRRSHAPEFGGETVNRLALERLRYGARLARETGLPILVTGGTVRDETPEAQLMQAALREDFGLEARWVETAARDTRENARFSAVHLGAADIDAVLLVTHAMHMKRAQAEFEAAGLAVIPAPTAWLGGGEDDAGADQALPMLPSQNTAYAGWFALHELLGGLAYRWSR